MSRRWTRAIAVLVVLGVVGLETATVLLTLGIAGLADVLVYAVYATVQATAGAIVIWHHPRHPIGWLLMLFALWDAAIGQLALAWGRRASAQGWPAGPEAEVVSMTSWIVGALGLVLLFLLFPDGRLPSRGWIRVVWVWAIGAALAIPGWALNPRLGSELVAGVNPFARDGVPAEALFVAGASLVSLALVAAVVCLVVRFRRSDGTERRQMKWIMLAASAVAIVLPTSAALWTIWPPVQLLASVALALLPAAACVAIVRHRLYDIDLVISRTVAYATLTGVLAATYAAIVLSAGVVVSSPLAAAGAALVVAVMFRPLRDRIQATVDRRFRRARYEARQGMLDFVDRLRRGAATADQVEDALRSAMQDDGLAVVYRPRADGPTYDLRGRRREPDPGRQAVTVVEGLAVIHRRGDERLLGEVVDAGRLALEIAALQSGLRRQLEELDASRARVVAVADEERRRLARDLHDGAQQRLVSIGLGLRHVQHELDGSMSADVDRTLEASVLELSNAIEELRELASGLRPMSLDAGLGSALRELAARTPLPIHVDTTAHRFSPELETAAYFIACEAISNAVKHARAKRVVLRVSQDDGALILTVDDDGRGGVDTSKGSGLTGLADRTRSYGGTLVIESKAGTGTRLEARLPCA